MNLRQPWEDTYSLLTGARIKRACRPGEQFDVVEQPHESIQFGRGLRRQITRIFLLLQITFR